MHLSLMYLGPKVPTQEALQGPNIPYLGTWTLRERYVRVPPCRVDAATEPRSTTSCVRFYGTRRRSACSAVDSILDPNTPKPKTLDPMSSTLSSPSLLTPRPDQPCSRHAGRGRDGTWRAQPHDRQAPSAAAVPFGSGLCSAVDWF